MSEWRASSSSLCIGNCETQRSTHSQLQMPPGTTTETEIERPIRIRKKIGKMKGKVADSYEESRRKRLEENRKRMEALNLPLLSQALTNSPNSKTKSSPLKRVKSRTIEKQVVVVRRSSRVANLPAPVYKEVVIDRIAIPRRAYNRHRDYSNRVYASEEAREEALEKAYKIQTDLESQSEHPTFVKSMLQSHVTGGFWLGLPVHFCRKNLPNKDEEITLIDEDGDEYPTIYLHGKTGLSGGWRGFSIAHSLVDGDALVFQLINRTDFKVYIVRVNGDAEDKTD